MEEKNKFVVIDKQAEGFLKLVKAKLLTETKNDSERITDGYAVKYALKKYLGVR